MKDYIEERAIEIADYIIATNATVRQAAKKLAVSKSNCSQRLRGALREINPSLASEVRRVLDVNKSERISAVEWRQRENTFTCINIGLLMRKNTGRCQKAGQRL